MGEGGGGVARGRPGGGAVGPGIGPEKRDEGSEDGWVVLCILIWYRRVERVSHEEVH